jgi:hypothetical protein
LHWAAKTNLLACVEQLLIAGACINAADKVFDLLFFVHFEIFALPAVHLCVW